MSNCMALAAAWAPGHRQIGKANAMFTNHLEKKYVQLICGLMVLWIYGFAVGLTQFLPGNTAGNTSFEIRDHEKNSCAGKVALTLLSGKAAVLILVHHVCKECETHHALPKESAILPKIPQSPRHVEPLKGL